MSSLSFEGSGYEYFKIWIVNILLTIVTLGIYYPWAKVRNNRYLYANSSLHDKNFEYHATGKQLFLGYLIGVVLLISYKIVSQIFPEATFIFPVVLAIVIPWLIWRSMKFNLNVTSFSNVRFKFDGELRDSYLIFIGYPLLFIFFAGILTLIMMSLSSFSGFFIFIGFIAFIALFLFAYAVFSVKKNSYLINSSCYGQGKFSTKLEVKEFSKIILKTFGISLLILSPFSIPFFMGFFGVYNDLITSGQYTTLANNTFLFSILAVGYIMFIILSFLPVAYYITRKREYIYDNTTLDEKIEFYSSIKFFKLAFIIIINYLAIIFSLGLAIPWAKVRLTRYMLENTHVNSAEDLSKYLNDTYEKQSAIGEEIGDAFNVDVGVTF